MTSSRASWHLKIPLIYWWRHSWESTDDVIPRSIITPRDLLRDLNPRDVLFGTSSNVTSSYVPPSLIHEYQTTYIDNTNKIVLFLPCSEDKIRQVAPPLACPCLLLLCYDYSTLHILFFLLIVCCKLRDLSLLASLGFWTGTSTPGAVSYTHLTLPTIYSV